MKNYQLKTIISILCFVLCGFALCLSVVCVVEWNAISESIIGSIVSIAYFIIGLCAKKGSQEDREDYINQHKSIEEIYNELSHLYKKYYWILDVDSTMPALKNKKKLLKWSIDISLVCLAYQHDYNTAKNDKQTNQDLDIMINLVQELIDNKKYL